MALRIDAYQGDAPAASFAVPADLEAREPAEVRGSGRDDVRLLVTSGSSGEATHARFADLPAFLAPGDVVVLNTSATVPSKLLARSQAGEQFVVHVSTRWSDGRCVVEPRAFEPAAGERATLDAGASLMFLSRFRGSARLWQARFTGVDDFLEFLHRWGKPIAYPHLRRAWPIETYQNVYATEAGSAEMASAGRPFTRGLLGRLRAVGVAVTTIVLHTGVSSPERDERPYPEQFRVCAEAAGRIAQARARGGRVIAVGTTVVRALESAVDRRGTVVPSEGWTDVFLSGREPLHTVDGMITGFHEPKSTHLMMLEALAGAEHVRKAYASALAGRYLWHEFGDSHLLLR
jgi:S-adenosylmethionine:tRNA ribosyltransferase-isomerase